MQVTLSDPASLWIGDGVQLGEVTRVGATSGGDESETGERLGSFFVATLSSSAPRFRTTAVGWRTDDRCFFWSGDLMGVDLAEAVVGPPRACLAGVGTAVFTTPVTAFAGTVPALDGVATAFEAP